jgi:hypothetical protein
METLLTLIILFLVPICGPQRGNGAAGRMKLDWDEDEGAHTQAAPENFCSSSFS